MHKSEPYGCVLLKQKDKQSESASLNFANKLAKLLPFGIDEIDLALTDLLEEKVVSIDNDMLVQKRMVKDNDISIKRSKSGSKGGKSTQSKPKNFALANTEANTVSVDEDVNEDTNTTIKSKEDIEFDVFWNLYDKKEGRATVEYKWQRIKHKDQLLIIEHLPKYVEATPDKKYRKLPMTYLSQKTWLDEELPSHGNSKETNNPVHIDYSKVDYTVRQN
jgi:hypothetical protein